MRYRNIKPRTAGVTGNSRTALLGRDVRSRIFANLDTTRLFQQARMDDVPFPTLRTVGEDGAEVRVSVQAARHEPLEWELPDPVPALPDALPPEQGPVDVRPGGADRPGDTDIVPRRQYTANSGTVSRSLNVTGPTVGNVAQVLNALLTDLGRRDLVTRVE